MPKLSPSPRSTELLPCSLTFKTIPPHEEPFTTPFQPKNTLVEETRTVGTHCFKILQIVINSLLQAGLLMETIGHALCAGAQEGIVSDNIRLAALPVHFIQHLQGQLPAASLLACRNQGRICYHVALAAPRHHVLKYPKGLLDLSRRIRGKVQSLHSSAHCLEYNSETLSD